MVCGFFSYFTDFEICIEVSETIEEEDNTEYLELDTVIWKEFEKCDEWCHPENRYETHSTTTRSRDKYTHHSPKYSSYTTRSILDPSHSKVKTPIDDPRDDEWEKYHHAPWEKCIEIRKKVTLVIGGDILDVWVDIPEEKGNSWWEKPDQKWIGISENFENIGKHRESLVDRLDHHFETSDRCPDHEDETSFWDMESIEHGAHPSTEED